ncbi:ABC transporter ATP-binding protein [Paenibacillus daejeonensis]|uniref:ABC transporter ATP-binding protein n=1 Tax=Paenibacillus daejeonensis TaxID=135193 RepID=UPI00037FD117|nr:ATP-binding cassette domain-containing protein [Paenibacillus daejeonensis]
MAIYRIRELSFSFPEQGAPALAHIDLNIMTGEFLTLCGRSGSGKSTLLRQLKPVLTPHGRREGEILYAGEPLASVDARRQAAEIGFVQQSADNSVVTDKVWHELAFGLESLGIDQQTIRLRVAEMASFFGIQHWFHAAVSELSGGQRQLLQLASVMAMQPSVLILDEPTSQLDPIAALDFLGTLARINRELGTTIILTEHRLEEVLPITDRLVVMEHGRIVADGAPLKAAEELRRLQHPMFRAMPSAVRIHAGVGSKLVTPLTVRDGRGWLLAHLAEEQVAPAGSGQHEGASSQTRSETAAARDVNPDAGVVAKQALVPALRFRDVWFRYEKHGADVLKRLSFDVQPGQLYAILGGNGAGKSTTLSLAAGLLRPYRGQVRVEGRDPAKVRPKELFHGGLAVLPQQPQTLFVQKTVALELTDMLRDSKLDEQARQDRIQEVIAFAELEDLLDQHPYDLSGGEQQRAALAKVLLLEPKILLLDEPTKGLDAFFKEKLADLLRRLQAKGVTVVLVSHDIEFCASYADRCALCFDGAMIAEGAVREFFAGSSFYTTAANRIARDLWREAVSVEDVIRHCQEETTR